MKRLLPILFLILVGLTNEASAAGAACNYNKLEKINFRISDLSKNISSIKAVLKYGPASIVHLQFEVNVFQAQLELYMVMMAEAETLCNNGDETKCQEVLSLNDEFHQFSVETNYVEEGEELSRRLKYLDLPERALKKKLRKSKAERIKQRARLSNFLKSNPSC